MYFLQVVLDEAKRGGERDKEQQEKGEAVVNGKREVDLAQAKAEQRGEWSSICKGPSGVKLVRRFMRGSAYLCSPKFVWHGLERKVMVASIDITLLSGPAQILART